MNAATILRYALPALAQLWPLVRKEIERRQMVKEQNRDIQVALIERKEKRRGKTVLEIVEEHQKK